LIVKGKLKELGNELKALRQFKRLSLSAVALPARISAAYLQKLEAGAVNNPSPPVLNRLAAVLEVSYMKLMELAGYITPATDDKVAGVKNSLVDQAVITEDLTEEERRAVAAFVSYLKEQRKD